ncbi:class I SAM-dependent methyltransferase [Solicola sp. PLA-1-18]|uniref:class I SAM-dependent methyltransferase n=1 Tax=Solicola sp. PLA-1-18 TaxID=3380532 RepID=UPI003B80B45D
MSGHYFDAEPGVADRRATIDTHVWGRDLAFTTASGVFSRDGLDKATDVLLRASAPPTQARTLLDLGCGWGPIACAVAVASPSTTVWAVDTNERARELTSANAEAHGVADRVRVAAPDEVPPDVVFDALWSNPPIRIGKAALHDLLLTWLPRLAPDGHARLVVGKNLGADSLQRWLGEQGWPTDRETSQKGFRVLVTRRAS